MAIVAISSASATSSAGTNPKPSLLLRPGTRISFPHSLHFPSSSSSLTVLSLSFTHPSLGRRWMPRAFALVGEEQVETSNTTSEGEKQEQQQVPEGKAPQVLKLQVRPCELYVCNLPRSCDIPDLVELFKPFGTVQSVEVSRNPETGISRGCGYVTMSSLVDAKAAIANLDGSDLGGREIHVKYSADTVARRKNTAALNTTTKKNMVFESPHKAYVGNIAWSVTPEDLREYFHQYGNVVSTRLLYDRKAGKNRVYGFISFSSEEELKAATASSGKALKGRVMLVRELVNK